MLSGKLDFNLITKETKFIDLSAMTVFNEKEFKRQKEIEKNSFTFKFFVHHNKYSNTIKFLNIDQNFNNTNKELEQNYKLVSFLIK